MDAPSENTVQVTFLPEGKTVTFEHGKLPYKDHGKEESKARPSRLNTASCRTKTMARKSRCST